MEEYGIHSTMSVPLQARGTTLGVAVFTRFRRPDPFTHDDVLLAEEVSARAAVCIDNARRYSREREATLTLQRSLLPRWLPPTAAVEAASRDLPAARSGVGGDWFDVIPLSGMRVAMVVGDVVGHGIPASATMGPAAHRRAHPRRHRPDARGVAHPPGRPGGPALRGVR
ncbi:hypothetical protein STENM223S_09852 [Streptomyces tendae]